MDYATHRLIMQEVTIPIISKHQSLLGASINNEDAV